MKIRKTPNLGQRKRQLTRQHNKIANRRQFYFNQLLGEAENK